MKRVGFLRTAGRIALKDLRLEWRTWESLSSSVVFSLIVLIVFNFAFDLATMRELGPQRLVPGVIWVTLAFASVVGFSRSFQLERRRDTLTALFLAPVDRGAIYTGKLLANLVQLTMLQWIVVPIAAVLFDFDVLSVAPGLAIVLMLYGLGLAELGTLFAAVASRVGRGEALLATLLFPASTPLFIAAVKSTAAVLDGGTLGSIADWLMMGAGLCLLYFLLALMTFEFMLEE